MLWHSSGGTGVCTERCHYRSRPPPRRGAATHPGHTDPQGGSIRRELSTGLRGVVSCSDAHHSWRRVRAFRARNRLRSCQPVDGAIARPCRQPPHSYVANRHRIAIGPTPAQRGGQRVGVEPLHRLAEPPFIPVGGAVLWPWRDDVASGGGDHGGWRSRCRLPRKGLRL